MLYSPTGTDIRVVLNNMRYSIRYQTSSAVRFTMFECTV